MLPVLLCLIVAADAHSAPPTAPAVPGYRDYGALTQAARQLAKLDGVELRSLGKSRGERDIWLLTLGDADLQGDTTAKPAILIVGDVDAANLLGSELALRMAEDLANRTSEKSVKQLLARCRLYFIPRPSPDAGERFFQPPYSGSALTTRETDDDRDGQVNEDPPEDLDGDGFITTMRVEDPAGTHLPHPDDPRVLIKADPSKNEQGRYLVYSEGRDNDQDQLWNEDGAGGVDVNRNFTFDYPYFEPGAGPHQVSEPESRALADFAFDHPEIAAVFCFSPQDNLFHPWKPSGGSENAKYKTAVREKDAGYLEYLAERYQQQSQLKDAPPSAAEDGALLHWAYFHYGRWAWGTRGWWPPEVSFATLQEHRAAQVQASRDPGPPEPLLPARKPSDEKRGKRELNLLRWLEKERIDGFTEWRPIEHPDFPRRKVEVGGFRPLVTSHPPAAQLDTLADRQVDFLLEWNELLPELEITQARAEKLGPRLYRVTATVVNQGFLPTAPLQGEEAEFLHPLQIEIVVPKGTRLLGGPRRVQFDRLTRGDKHDQRWLIQLPDEGAEQLAVRVWSPSVGEATATVNLP